MPTMPNTSRLDVDQTALERVGASMQADIDVGRHYGGAVLVARGGEVVYRERLGAVAPGRPATDDDLYLLMSLSKAFTATLVLQAVDHGRFTLSTPVAELVPGFGQAGKERSTVAQLLCHTAGLPTALVPAGVNPQEAGDLAVKAEAVSALPAAYEPGTQCAYTSGLGYDLLGQILVSTDPAGRGFAQIAREELFEPLGMTSARFGGAHGDPRLVPVSHTESMTTPASLATENLLNDVLARPGAEFPSGNAYATMNDVLRFSELLRGRGTANGHRLLSPALVDYALADHTPGLVNQAILPDGQPLAGITPEDRLPARFTLLGGYIRGEGTGALTPAGLTASPRSYAAVGGASTGLLYDPARDLTVIILTAGFIEGLEHMRRLQRLNDLALAAVDA